MRIWNLQSLYPELEDQMSILCNEVYSFITRDDRLTENVTEWCKKEACWERAKKESWTFTLKFIKTLMPNTVVNEEKKEEKEKQKIGNEVDSLKLIIAYGPEYWKKVLRWAQSHTGLSDMEYSIIIMIINMNYTGKLPSVKQAKVALKARERLISNGMPLQF